MKLIPRNKINDNEWNAWLEKIPGNQIYSLSWYMDALSEKWMIARDDSGKNRMLFPYKSKAGVKLIYQPFFSREIVCHLDQHHSPADIIARLPSGFRQVEFSLRDIRGIDTKKFKVEKWKHQVLDLHRSYPTIAKNYSDNAKRMVKKASAAGFRVEETSKVSLVIDLFRKSKGDELKEIKDEDYKKLQKLMSTALKNGAGKCFQVVSGEREVLAAGFFFLWNGRLTYLKGSANEKGKKTGAMYLMFDELIRQWAGRITELDFGGSRISNVAAFYKKFGAEDSEYYFIKHQNLPLYFKWLKAAGKMLKR